MLESSHDLRKATPAQLARLLGADLEEVGNWRVDELGAILQHQLASPVLADIQDLELEQPEAVLTMQTPAGTARSSATYADVFYSDHPSLELLALVKQFAKANLTNPQRSLPREIASLLYYVSIASARLRCGERLSKVTDAELRSGLEWALAQPWLDQLMRTRVAEDLTRL